MVRNGQNLQPSDCLVSTDNKSARTWADKIGSAFQKEKKKQQHVYFRKRMAVTETGTLSAENDRNHHSPSRM